MAYRKMRYLFVTILISGMAMTPCTSIRSNDNADLITIGLAGDVMLGRLVNEEINKHGYAYPWGDMIDELRTNDLNLVNLETTLTKSNKQVIKVFNFKADPNKVKTLKEGNIGAVNLANNHILDFSSEGLKETIDVLDKAHIQHVGAGPNAAAAKEPAIIEIKGSKIGIIGYTDNEPTWKAGAHKAGTNYILVGQIDQVKTDIKNLRDKVDLLILSIHWGPNMREEPNRRFVDFAHELINAGVDIIHGHSAHVIQGIEIYKNKVILYDTGDFVDDYMVGPELRNDYTFLFRIVAQKSKIKELSLVPALIKNMQVNHAPTVDREIMEERIKNLSRQFGTKFEMSGNALKVKLP